MLSCLPTDKQHILWIAHNSDYDCRFVLPILQNIQPIDKSNRCLQIKATCYNPILKQELKIVIKYSYKSI